MIFSKENQGKWVASKQEKVIATSEDLTKLVKQIEKRSDKKNIRFDKVPSGFFVGLLYGI